MEQPVKKDRKDVELREIRHLGNQVLLATLVLSALLAIAIGKHYGTMASATVTAALLLASGGLAFAFGSGGIGSTVLTLSNAAMVALHIQLGRGTIEFHFGVFALLALVLVYRDWRPILCTAGFFAVHHVLFDRLQALGYGTFCIAEPDLIRVIGHAGYVVVQTSIEVFIAVTLRKAALQNAELQGIVSRLTDGTRISLDVRELDIKSPVGVKLFHAIGQLRDAITEVSATATVVEQSSTRISSNNRRMSHSTEMAAHSIAQMSRSMEDITREVAASEESAAQADHLVKAASRDAHSGTRVVGCVIEKMLHIQESSKSIAEITRVIDSISFQTNILALNAAVEASRAGEQGRGFAVVASEVRSLAARSAAASKEIRHLIETSVRQIGEGATLASTAGTSMAAITTSIDEAKAALENIATRTAIQRTQIVDVNTALSGFRRTTEDNVRFVQETSAEANDLAHRAKLLSDNVKTFH